MALQGTLDEKKTKNKIKKQQHPNNIQSYSVKKRPFHVLDSDVCSKHGVKKSKYFFIKQNENIWQILILLQGIPLYAFHKPEDIHINTDMVEQQNIWKWHGWKATTRQTFNSLVCGPLKASNLGWIIVANYFNYMLTQLPQHSWVNCTHRPSWPPHTTYRKHFE